MKYFIVGLAIFASVLCANAQEQSPEVQILGQRLMNELRTSLECSVQQIVVKQELAKAQAEIKRLTEKYEPQAK